MNKPINQTTVIVNGKTRILTTQILQTTPMGGHYWSASLKEEDGISIIAQSMMGPSHEFDAIGWLIAKLPEIQQRLEMFGKWDSTRPLTNSI